MGLDLMVKRECTEYFAWICFYDVMLKEVMGNHEMVEKGILKVVELIKDIDDDIDDDNELNEEKILKLLSLMKSNDKRSVKCYDKLIALLKPK